MRAHKRCHSTILAAESIAFRDRAQWQHPHSKAWSNYARCSPITGLQAKRNCCKHPADSRQQRQGSFGFHLLVITNRTVKFCYLDSILECRLDHKFIPLGVRNKPRQLTIRITTHANPQCTATVSFEVHALRLWQSFGSMSVAEIGARWQHEASLATPLWHNAGSSCGSALGPQKTDDEG
eukprot:5819092-Amphidinium_carterae.1